ncbi:MAG: tyrosine-type recombinase/integrase, partial [Bryobacteraceae bacterium]
MHLIKERTLAPNTVKQRMAALRFLFVNTLRRPYPVADIPYPKVRRKLPNILSPDEVARMIEAVDNLLYRTILMTLYSTGMRRSEVCRLKVADIDSQRMVIHIRQGKGNKDRDVPLSAKLLDTLREYWRWMRPKTYLFPGLVNGWRADVPITGKVVWLACAEAAKRAGITKPVHPHTLRVST